MKKPKFVIVAVEPSKRLSQLLGRSYIVEKQFPIEELKGIINAGDINRMKKGEQIHKELPILRGDEI